VIPNGGLWGKQDKEKMGEFFVMGLKIQAFIGSTKNGNDSV